jgi:hypothetical protein
VTKLDDVSYQDLTQLLVLAVELATLLALIVVSNSGEVAFPLIKCRYIFYTLELNLVPDKLYPPKNRIHMDPTNQVLAYHGRRFSIIQARIASTSTRK